MAQDRSLIYSSLLGLFLIAGFGPVYRISGQEPEFPTLRGNITAVESPDDFDVDGYHVVLSPDTQFFALNGPKKDQSELRRSIAIGTYVQVIGDKDRHARTVTARQVKVREGGERTLSGVSVIDHILSQSPLPVFRADGYTMRVAADTEVSFTGNVKGTSDIVAGVWVGYEGKRSRSGEVVATSAKFFKPKLHKPKHDPASVAQVTDIRPGSLIDFDGSLHTKHEKHRLEDAGGQCGWYPVPDIPSVQENIRRIGMSLVPKYQRDLPADSPEKIPFRFYVVEEKYIRSDLFCTDGLVLVPATIISRLKNQDQLAAVVADGVAAHLQRQQARVAVDLRFADAAELAAYVALNSAGALGASAFVGGAVVKHEIERKMQDQRGRVALALMADAGYDPWQAPEAWRLLDPKQLPKDPKKLKYPDRAGYQFEILGMQYRPPAGIPTTTTQAGDAGSKSD